MVGHLKGEPQGGPLFTPQVGQDAGGHNGERQTQQDAHLTTVSSWRLRTKKFLTITIDYSGDSAECLPCDSSVNEVSGALTADRQPAAADTQ